MYTEICIYICLLIYIYMYIVRYIMIRLPCRGMATGCHAHNAYTRPMKSITPSFGAIILS